MNFTYTEQQEMLRKTAFNFLETYCPKTLVIEIEKHEKKREWLTLKIKVISDDYSI